MLFIQMQSEIIWYFCGEMQRKFTSAATWRNFLFKWDKMEFYQEHKEAEKWYFTKNVKIVKFQCKNSKVVLKLSWVSSPLGWIFLLGNTGSVSLRAAGLWQMRRWNDLNSWRNDLMFMLRRSAALQTNKFPAGLWELLQEALALK